MPIRLFFLGTASAAVLLVGASSLAPAPARSAPTVLAAQPGMIRQVVQGDGYTAWTRCRGRRGPTDVWAARGTKPPRRVAGLGRGGACEPQRLVGIAGGRLIVDLPVRGGRELVAVPLRGGTRRTIVASSVAPGGLELVDAASGGRRVAWIQVVGAPADRVAQVVALDLRRDAPAVVHERALSSGAIELTGVWISPSGRVAFRERLRGAQYGYGAGADRVRLRSAGGVLRELVRTSGPVRVAGAALSNRWFTYSLTREGDRRVWITARDLARGTKRRLRVARAAPPRLALAPPAGPAPELSGGLGVWRERLRKGGRFTDSIRSSRALRTDRRVVERRIDVRGQRLFQSAPVVSRGVATWAIIEFRRATGWRGGYAGLSRVPARSTVVRERIPGRG